MADKLNMTGMVKSDTRRRAGIDVRKTPKKTV